MKCSENCKGLARRASVSAACLAVIVSIGCSHVASMPVPEPPRASDAVRAELHALEGTAVCKSTRDFLLEEVSPYFAEIDAFNR